MGQLLGSRGRLGMISGSTTVGSSSGSLISDELRNKLGFQFLPGRKYF